MYFESLGGKAVGAMVEAEGREMHWVEVGTQRKLGCLAKENT